MEILIRLRYRRFAYQGEKDKIGPAQGNLKSETQEGRNSQAQGKIRARKNRKNQRRNQLSNTGLGTKERRWIKLIVPT